MTLTVDHGNRVTSFIIITLILRNPQVIMIQNVINSYPFITPVKWDHLVFSQSLLVALTYSLGVKVVDDHFNL